MYELDNTTTGLDIPAGGYTGGGKPTEKTATATTTVLKHGFFAEIVGLLFVEGFEPDIIEHKGEFDYTIDVCKDVFECDTVRLVVKGDTAAVSRVNKDTKAITALETVTVHETDLEALVYKYL